MKTKSIKFIITTLLALLSPISVLATTYETPTPEKLSQEWFLDKYNAWQDNLPDQVTDAVIGNAQGRIEAIAINYTMNQLGLLPKAGPSEVELQTKLLLSVLSHMEDNIIGYVGALYLADHNIAIDTLFEFINAYMEAPATPENNQKLSLYRSGDLGSYLQDIVKIRNRYHSDSSAVENAIGSDYITFHTYLALVAVEINLWIEWKRQMSIDANPNITDSEIHNFILDVVDDPIKKNLDHIAKMDTRDENGLNGWRKASNSRFSTLDYNTYTFNGSTYTLVQQCYATLIMGYCQTVDILKNGYSVMDSDEFLFIRADPGKYALSRENIYNDHKYQEYIKFLQSGYEPSVEIREEWITNFLKDGTTRTLTTADFDLAAYVSPQNMDNDNDGLPNIYEGFSSNLSDMNNPDTDDDGILDGYEYYSSAMSPTVYDSTDDYDGDGLSNYSEYKGCIGGDTTLCNMSYQSDPANIGSTPTGQRAAILTAITSLTLF